jgi:ABC-type phosphate/phosphonate transport system permease subunit
MLKLIAIILAALPVVLFLRSLFKGPLRRSPAVSRAVSDFKRHIDYLVWAIFVVMACGVVYSIAKLIMN